MKRRLLTTLFLLAVPVLGCEDSLGPREAPNPSEPTETTLHDFLTAEIRQPSAFDVLGAEPVRTDQTPAWDYLFYIPQGGVPEFRPRALVLDASAASGLRRVDRGFEALEQAPEGGYVTDRPVELVEGEVYALRSRQSPGFSISCRKFGKMEVLDVDATAGTVTFRHLINPNCENRSLVPGPGDEGETGSGG